MQCRCLLEIYFFFFIATPFKKQIPKLCERFLIFWCFFFVSFETEKVYFKLNESETHTQIKSSNNSRVNSCSMGYIVLYLYAFLLFYFKMCLREREREFSLICMIIRNNVVRCFCCCCF
jgi:hypothetical protein